MTSTANLLVIDDSFLSAAATCCVGRVLRGPPQRTMRESPVAIDAGVPTFLAALDPRAAVFATGFQRTLPVTVTVPAVGSSLLLRRVPPASGKAQACRLHGGRRSTSAALAAGPPNCVVLPAGVRMRFNAGPGS